MGETITTLLVFALIGVTIWKEHERVSEQKEIECVNFSSGEGRFDIVDIDDIASKGDTVVIKICAVEK